MATNRRSLLRRWLLTGSGLAATGAGVAAYGRSQARQPQVERVTITLPTLPLAFDGLRAVVLGDLHVCPSFPVANLAPALALAQAEKPELLLLVGDYICDREGDYQVDMAACVKVLEPLAKSAPLGAFAAFGNHDFPAPPFDPPKELWQAAGITPLLDSSGVVLHEKAVLWVAGMRSAISRPTEPRAVLARATPDACRILLWHEPDRAAQAAGAGAALMLSGHTHGGQVVVPGIGPLRLPDEGRRYPAGLVFVEGMPLYTTRGVGVLPPRLRLNCPPEVTVLTLRRGKAPLHEAGGGA